MTISERIYELMRIRNMTQMEFCKKTGIPQSTVSEWRRKNLNPTAERILKICEVLEVSPYELLQENGGADTPKVDYIVTSEGTPRYELLIEFDKLGDKQKERVFGFIQAMQTGNKQR